MPTEAPKTNRNRSGVWYVIAREARLVGRLMLDKRVPWYLKLLPVGAVAYVVWPADLLPFNPLDDAALVSAAFYLLIELCPPAVVEEHRQSMKGVISGQWRDIAPPPQVAEPLSDAEEPPDA